MNRAVFLDRDGVLNEAIMRDNAPFSPRTLDEFVLVPEAAAQIARLRQAGLFTIVITNQPEIARGLLNPNVIEDMHRHLREVIPLEGIMVCPHDGAEGCECRKPAPGMLLQAAGEWDIDLAHSFLVGDRWRDVDAGKAAGCFTILLRRPYDGCQTADATVDSLTEAVDLILSIAETKAS